MVYVFKQGLTHSVKAIHISIFYANINIFIHSVSGGLHGILVPTLPFNLHPHFTARQNLEIDSDYVHAYILTLSQFVTYILLTYV